MKHFEVPKMWAKILNAQQKEKIHFNDPTLLIRLTIGAAQNIHNLERFSKAEI
ncbi:hypothetical protein KR52_09025 [Synechococcus sp. KORDI-52]|nr:hypothetical protein KR52_09025 [Synechococcus sp. KORDI-52]